MSFIKDTFFGGAQADAAESQADAAREGQRLIQQNLIQARGEAIPLFQGAEQNLLGGIQGALDVFGQSLPAQTQAFQQGNINAQQQLLAGLPQIQAALLGGNVDFSGLQPSQVDTSNLGFFQQQLPDFQTIEQSLNLSGQSPQVATGPQVSQPSFSFSPINTRPMFTPDAGGTGASFNIGRGNTSPSVDFSGFVAPNLNFGGTGLFSNTIPRTP